MSEIYCKVISPLGMGMFKIELPNGDFVIAKLRSKNRDEKIARKNKQKKSKIVANDYVEVYSLEIKINSTGYNYVISRKISYEDINKLMKRNNKCKEKKLKTQHLTISSSKENFENGIPITDEFIDSI